MNKSAGYIGYQLRELVRDGVIGSIFTDPNNPDDFIAGYVRAINPRTVLVEAITPYGRFDGYFGIRIATIQEVQFDAAYANRLELVRQLLREPIPPIEWAQEDDHIVSILRYSRDTNCGVTIWTATESYAGFAAEVNDLYLDMQPVDFMGERCPGMTFRLTDIEMISVGSEEEKMFEMLDRYHRDGPVI